MKDPIILLITLGVMFGCSNPQTRESTQQSDLIQLTRDQIEFNDIKTGKLQKGLLYHTIKATGRVDVPPNYSLSLSTPIKAYVVKVFVLPGYQVKKGAIIAQLRHPSIAEVQHDFLATKGQVEFLQADIKRKESLLEGNAVSTREYEKLKSELINSEAKLTTIVSELNRLGIDPDRVSNHNITQYLDMIAPVSGVVTDVFQKKGEFVDANMPMINLLNREHEHVELEVFQEDLMKVRKGMLVKLRLPGSEEVYNGNIFLINSQLDHETLSANVHVHPGENFPDIPVNSMVFGEVVFKVDTSYTLPRNEVMREGGSYFIFTRSAGGFEKTEVIIGFDDQTNIEITGPSDIFEKEVVLQGNYYLNGV